MDITPIAASYRPITTPAAPTLPVTAPAPGTALTGSVAYFNVEHGFGLLMSDGAPRPDVFVHVSELLPPATTLNIGDRVSFVRVEASRDEKMPHATSVRVLTQDA